MSDKTLSSIIGGGELTTLAPDLTLPSRLTSGSGAGAETVTIDPSGSLTTALSLTGKYAIYYLNFTGLPTTESVTIKLTVDGVIIHNSPFTPSFSGLSLYAIATNDGLPGFKCNSSLLLEVQTVADNSVTLNFLTRAIL